MKKIVLILLLIFPLYIKAEKCDFNKHEEYLKFADHISYDTEYNRETKMFDIIFYNAVDGIYAMINKNKYERNSKDEIVISNIKQGSNLMIYIYGDDGCNSQINNFYIKIPYYNDYYNSDLCKNYKNILTLCSSEFTSTLATKENIKSAIESYETQILSDIQKPEDDVIKRDVVKETMELLQKIVLPILIVIASTLVAISIGSRKFRLVKHGI